MKAVNNLLGGTTSPPKEDKVIFLWELTGHPPSRCIHPVWVKGGVCVGVCMPGAGVQLWKGHLIHNQCSSLFLAQMLVYFSSSEFNAINHIAVSIKQLIVGHPATFSGLCRLHTKLKIHCVRPAYIAKG